MKIRKLLILGIYFFLSVGFYAKAEGERAAWLAERKQTIEEAKADPSSESIEKLGILVSGLGRQKNRQPDVENILSDAKEVMLSIPNYADYFGDKIKAITDAEIAGTSNAHTSQRGWYFETLTQLQSPETLRVLGEALFDERNPFKGTSDDTAWVATCMYAEGALFKLGLNNPPVNAPYLNYEDDLHTWQLWYQQIRAGTRTFSFKGDDRIYTLAGPVTEPKDAGTSAAARQLPSPASPIVAATPTKLKWPLIVAIFATVIALFAVFNKRKKPPAVAS